MTPLRNESADRNDEIFPAFAETISESEDLFSASSL